MSMEKKSIQIIEFSDKKIDWGVWVRDIFVPRKKKGLQKATSRRSVYSQSGQETYARRV